MMLRSISPQALLLLLQRLAAQQGWDAIEVTDDKALDEALAYPLLQAMQYRADVADLAAAHVIGMLRHRPFSVRSEQAALLAMGLFLYLNSWPLQAPQGETARMLWQASAGDLDESMLADWIRQHV